MLENVRSGEGASETREVCRVTFINIVGFSAFLGRMGHFSHGSIFMAEDPVQGRFQSRVVLKLKVIKSMGVSEHRPFFCAWDSTVGSGGSTSPDSVNSCILYLATGCLG